MHREKIEFLRTYYVVDLLKSTCTRYLARYLGFSLDLGMMDQCISASEVECPAQVSDERKVAFVERESGDVALAASRLARHWKFRLAHFGEDSL